MGTTVIEVNQLYKMKPNPVMMLTLMKCMLFAIIETTGFEYGISNTNHVSMRTESIDLWPKAFNKNAECVDKKSKKYCRKQKKKKNSAQKKKKKKKKKKK